MKKLWAAKLFFLLILLAPLMAEAKDTYPKLANYYLAFFHQQDYEKLAKWDLLVIQAEMPMYNPGFFDLYRRVNPGGKLVPYIYPAMFYEEKNPANYAGLPLRKYVLDNINQNNWWLKNGNGGSVYVWPQLRVVNLTNQQWQNFNVSYLRDRLGMNNWDGIMYDTVDAEIQHYSAQGIDIDNDGSADSTSEVNQRWRTGMAQLFAKTRQMIGPNKIIIHNGNSLAAYQSDTNGRIFENFPTPWEGNGSWHASMYQYLKRLPNLNRDPDTYIINATTNNTGNFSNYRQMRFGLTSALLGDGYFAFDYGDQSHQQLWWYDEYDVALGRAESSYYNLLNNRSDYVEPGLWRRDFENGVAIVNASGKDQLYIFPHEQFEKIRGTQDRNTNDGSKVNYVRLKNNDGIIMRRVKQDVVASIFPNGNFIRVFSNTGQQTRNGFFAYRADSLPNALVLLDDIDNDAIQDRVAEQNGTIVVARTGRAQLKIQPFGPNFKGKLSFAAYDFNKDGSKEIVVAPASSGGPHIKIYSLAGKEISPGFFAFDKNLRGGITLAAGDVNNDGKGEIIAAPLKGLPGTVKFFTQQGTLVGSILAYDKNFRGGVNVAVGDVDNDGKNELVTGAASGGPHVRIFDSFGRLKGQFMAFDPKSNSGISVMVADADGDGRKEILAGTASF